jgi:hypothetical protein
MWKNRRRQAKPLQANKDLDAASCGDSIAIDKESASNPKAATVSSLTQTIHRKLN